MAFVEPARAKVIGGGAVVFVERVVVAQLHCRDEFGVRNPVGAYHSDIFLDQIYGPVNIASEGWNCH